ncbi:type II toxin-antitoxin system PemK/MazF family toxin [Paraburkholderia aspalathi]|uniref:type II toxin-antitoxin system PemK/MazF family toxin n=1 Tax=Paraburkholderia aspalathi TaxID=1324617 RepID=UPI0038B6BA67
MTGSPWVPDRRDIIWIDYNPHVNQGKKVLHPLLVLSPRAFNDRTGIVIGLPMASAQQHDTNPFAIRFQDSENVTSYVLGHQPRAFDWRVRGAKAHPWKQAPDDVFTAACEQLNQIIAICD